MTTTTRIYHHLPPTATTTITVEEGVVGVEMTVVVEAEVAKVAIGTAVVEVVMVNLVVVVVVEKIRRLCLSLQSCYL